MKVALELQPCCGNRSGIGQYTYELAKRLHDQGNLEFCGNLFNFMSRNETVDTLSEIQMPIRISTIFPYGVYRRIWNVMPISYDKFFEQADLNVFFNFVVPPRIKGKVITTIHDMTYLRFPETMERRNLKRLKNGIQHSVKRSNRILTDSEFSKREIVELLSVPEHKVSVVSCAPSLTSDVALFADLKQKYKITHPYVLYVGTIEPRKNLSRLVNAFAQLQECENLPHQLVLAGGKGWENEDIYQTVDKMFHNGEVIFTGYVTNAEKNALYQNAELFVFPSLYEGFGIPPLEAMTFGCPVVSSNAASLPEVVGDAAELVDPMNTESIAKGMWKVLSDDLYRAELAQKGYKQAKKFNWDDSAKKLMQICREVLEET